MVLRPDIPQKSVQTSPEKLSQASIETHPFLPRKNHSPQMLFGRHSPEKRAQFPYLRWWAQPATETPWAGQRPGAAEGIWVGRATSSKAAVKVMAQDIPETRNACPSHNHQGRKFKKHGPAMDVALAQARQALCPLLACFPPGCQFKQVSQKHPRRTASCTERAEEVQATTCLAWSTLLSWGADRKVTCCLSGGLVFRTSSIG